MYHAQWKHIQVPSEIFWKLWRREYLQNFQTRRKWWDDRPNLKVGDASLLKNNVEHRTDWLIDVITETYQRRYEKVRKDCVCVYREDKMVSTSVLLMKW